MDKMLKQGQRKQGNSRKILSESNKNWGKKKYNILK